MTTVEVQRTKDGWKLKAIIGTAAIFAVVILSFVFRLEAGLIMLGLGSVGAARLWWKGWDAHQDRQLNRRERAAEVGIAEEQHRQAIIQTQQMRLAGRIIETRFGVFAFASLDDTGPPEYYAPTAGERKMLIENQQLALPESRPDLLKVFTQEQGVYAIIGAPRSGKTYQAMHIADWWLARGIMPLVIGPKRKPGEWIDCERLITDDTDKLNIALQKIVQLSRMRHAGKEQISPQPVFCDDWVWFVQYVDFAEQFMAEAGTVMASANIILYFILQSDSKDAFGVGRLGAMLKRNYFRLYLKPEKNEDGVIIPGQSSGYLIYPNESIADKQPLDLIAGIPRCVELQPAESGSTAKLPEIESEPEPTPREQIILDMFDDGASFNQISKQINEGRTGGPYNKEIKVTLGKFGKMKV